MDTDALPMEKLLALPAIAAGCAEAMELPKYRVNREFLRGVGATAVWLGGGLTPSPVRKLTVPATAEEIVAEHVSAGRIAYGGGAGQEFAIGVALMLEWARDLRDDPPVAYAA